MCRSLYNSESVNSWFCDINDSETEIHVVFYQTNKWSFVFESETVVF